jgi:hypothetical protein
MGMIASSGVQGWARIMFEETDALGVAPVGGGARPWGAIEALVFAVDVAAWRRARRGRDYRQDAANG